MSAADAASLAASFALAFGWVMCTAALLRKPPLVVLFAAVSCEVWLAAYLVLGALGRRS